MIRGADAGLALRLFLHAPHRFGGLWVRGSGESLLQACADRLPLRRLPLTIDDDRLIGGIDLADSLVAGRPVTRPGLLADAAGQGLVIRGAERMTEALAGRLAQARDQGGPWLLLVDEGKEDERAPAALSDRVAFWVEENPPLAEVPSANPYAPAAIDPPRLETLGSVALAFGVDSVRAMLFALSAAEVHAALHGRSAVDDEDVIVAARLVLAPRATRIPVEQDQPETASERASESSQPLEDVVVEAVRPHLPPDLSAASAGRSAARNSARGHGARSRSRAHGRTVGSRDGMPTGGLRLALVETLRQAAPWQGVRGRGDGSLRLRRDDFRVRRFEDRETVLTVFAVDASGSAAFARLAEAKGAVELLLERAYAKRAEVALIVFRGDKAELLLPPTRSLARARKLLADMPGGGATPLAAGLDAAREVARAGRAKGRTSQIVVLTDGRANVAASGEQSRSQGVLDALASARRLAADGLAATVLDISPRAQSEAAELAAALRARLVHLPRADAAALAAAAA